VIQKITTSGPQNELLLLLGEKFSGILYVFCWIRKDFDEIFDVAM